MVFSGLLFSNESSANDTKAKNDSNGEGKKNYFPEIAANIIDE